MLAHPLARYLNHSCIHGMVVVLTLWHIWNCLVSSDLHLILMGFFLAHWVTDILSAIGHYSFEIWPQDDWRLAAHMHEPRSEVHHTDVLNYADFTAGDKLSFAYAGVIPMLLGSFFLEPTSLAYATATGCHCWGLIVPFVHDWAHRRAHNFPVPLGVDWLQDHYIFLSGRQHNKHHFISSSKNYGLLSGNTDRLTDLFLWKPTHLDEKFDKERRRVIARLIAARRKSPIAPRWDPAISPVIVCGDPREL